MFCGNCGNELKPGARFCPSCGSAVKPVQARTDESTWASAPADQPEAEAGSTAAAPVMTKTKRQWTRKRKTMAVAGVVLILIALFATLGGSGGYADGLVEADNAYGLSTTVTLDEFIDLYNQRLAEINNIERGGNYEILLWAAGGIDKQNAEIFPGDSGMGLTRYSWINSVDAYVGLTTHVIIDIDNVTGYVVTGGVAYLDEEYNSNSTPDGARQGILEKLDSILYAMAGGKADRYEEWLEVTLAQEAVNQWDKGLSFISVLQGETMYEAIYASTEAGFEENNHIVY